MTTWKPPNRSWHAGSILPIEVTSNYSRVAAFIAMVLGTACIWASGTFLPVSLKKTPQDPLNWVFAFIALLGLYFIFRGLHGFVTRLTLTITDSFVGLEKRGLFGTTNWQENLSSYLGIQNTQFYVSGGKNRSGYYVYEARLKHAANKKRDIIIYTTKRKNEVRQETENFARLFQLPIVIKNTDGNISERKLEDLDKSIREQVKDGTLHAGFDPNTALTDKHFEFVPKGNGYQATVRYKNGWIVGALFLVVGLALAIWSLGFRGDIGAGVFGIAFAMIGLFVSLFMGSGAEILEIQPNEIKYFFRVKRFNLKTTTIPASIIEEVRIHSLQQRGKPTLQIISDTSQINFGMMLSKDEQEWLKQCVISVIGNEAH